MARQQVREKVRVVYPLSLDRAELVALESITSKLDCSRAEGIREAIRNFAEVVRGFEVTKLRTLPREEAKKAILGYLKANDRAWSSEIADSLRLDIVQVSELLEELWREERVEPTRASK